MHPKHRDALIKKAEVLSAKIDRAEQRLAEMDASNAAPDPLCSCSGCIGYQKPPKRYSLPEWWKAWSELERLRAERCALYEERRRLGQPELERLWDIPEWDDAITAEHEAWCAFISWV